MARFDTGVRFDSGARYDEPTPKPPKKRKSVNRQAYYPSRISSQVTWLQNFKTKLPGYATTLGLASGDVTAAVADASWLTYVLGSWLTSVRAWGPSCTDYVEDIQTGSGTPALPTFTAPAVPTGVVPVEAGALGRIFDLAGEIKRAAGYTEAIGTDLGIVGSEDAADHPVPGLKVTVIQGASSQVARLAFTKYTHQGVYLESRRGTGDWAMVGIDTESPYLDERPLLAAGQPETREYRARYWDKGTPNGDWTDTAQVTLAP